MLIESLARQIKDAKLFEKTRIASWGKLSTTTLIEIAQVYTKAYHYGVRYLKKLDKLAISVTDWLGFHTRKIFKDQRPQS